MNAHTPLIQPAVRWLRKFSRERQPLVADGAVAPGERASTLADIDHTFTIATNTRLAATVRLISCFAAAHIVLQLYLTERQLLWLPIVLLILFLFTVYAGALYWLTVRDSAFQEPQVTYWVDTLWYLGFTAMTGGPQSHFSFFLPFPVLFISLRWGFAPGITMTLCSTATLFVLGVLVTGPGKPVAAAYSLLPPIALLVLGYLIATWANSGLALSRRLALLKKIDSLFNPRLNIEQIIDRVVRQLVTLYPVHKYALVLVEGSCPARVFRADLPDRISRVSDTAAADLIDVLSSMAASHAVVYHGGRGLRRAKAYGFVAENAAPSSRNARGAAVVANRLDCAGFCSIQFNLRQGGTARLFICSDESCFGPADLPFFRQLGEQLSPRIENVQLLDRLAREVAEQERQKISRDIHDSTIQPYIGLKFALEALNRRVAPGEPLSKDIGRLVEMASMEITQLRRYVKGLRGEEKAGNPALVPAVRRQAARFGELYGITVDVEAMGEIGVNDDLAEEAFHMVSEGLSNIRRHTNASRARINLSCDMRNFKLQITNPCDAGVSAKSFTPSSISERALALGGACHVETEPGRDTVVTIEIPLRS